MWLLVAVVLVLARRPVEPQVNRPMAADQYLSLIGRWLRLIEIFGLRARVAVLKRCRYAVSVRSVIRNPLPHPDPDLMTNARTSGADKQ